MHKVQMNSGFNPEKVKKRIACFDEFDNGHVLHHYEKMSVADSEERARQASISDKTNVYYVSYDDIMEPCSDTYWFQGKSYDNSGARRALQEYRKTLTQNSSRRLNSAASADDLVKLSTVTLKRKLKNATPEEKKCIIAELNARGVYLKKSTNSACKLNAADSITFVDKIRNELSGISATIKDESSSEDYGGCVVITDIDWGVGPVDRTTRFTLHEDYEYPDSVYIEEEYTRVLLHNLRRWLRNNQGILFNSSRNDVNSNRKVGNNSMRKVIFRGKLNSSRRKLNSSTDGSCFATLWPAYIDDEYKCACCGKRFPAGHNSVSLGGHKPDGMHFIFEYTKENRVGNSVNYDPYNLPPEDSEGGIFKVIVGEEADDEGYRWLNFCRNCWPKLTSMSPEEIYAKYSPSVNASKSCNSNRKVGNNSMRKVVFRGKLNSSRKKLNSNVDSRFEKYFDKVTDQQLADFYGIDVEEIIDVNKDIENANYGKVVGHYIPKAKYAEVLVDGDWESLDILDNGTVGFSLGEGGGRATRFYGVDIDTIEERLAEASINSSRKPAQRVARKKLNSAAGSGFEKYFDKVTDQQLADFYGIPVEETIEVNKDIENAGYGKVVGHYIPKDKYAEVLVDGDWESLDILDNGTVGFSLGEGGGKAVRFYGVDIDSIKEAVEDAGLDSSRKLDSARKLGASYYASQLKTAMRNSTDEWYNSLIYVNKRANDYTVKTVVYDDNMLEAAKAKAAELGIDISIRESSPNSKGMVGAIITVPAYTEEVNSSRKRLNSSVAETEVQDTGVDGGEDAADTAELLEDALIVQNPETKEVSLFVVTEDDETVPEDVDVVAEVTPVTESAVLDSSRRLKKFATSKLNSSKGCLNSDSEDVCPTCGKSVGDCTCDPSTVAYDEIQLPDDTIVEVENILVVKGEDDDLGLFMPEDSSEIVPEDYEVVAVATPIAEAEVLDSSRRVKKSSNVKKLNSSVKIRVRGKRDF